ncbi:MAG: hypothetical protein LH660_14305 [Phormidesmis sp. CAN_BIN36]|nr:hypothetical protein [Phormidesmis sp. CAN_BIN36]
MRSKLEQWFWCGSCASLYTSWHESRASRDMLEVPTWLLQGGTLPTTITEATFTASRLLTTQRRYGAVYRSISALLRRHGAIDFATGETLSDVQFFNDPIESHHIFPVAYCKQQGIAVSQYNCLVNRTPLSQLSNSLYERFDYLYRGRHLPDTQNLMCYGFQCGDGWFNLTYELSEQIERYCQQHPEAADLIAVQVREKFGELRFYVSPLVVEVEHLIEQARVKSRQTCERTGNPGVMCRRSDGYYQTLCLETAAPLGFEPVRLNPPTPLPDE